MNGPDAMWFAGQHVAEPCDAVCADGGVPGHGLCVRPRPCSQFLDNMCACKNVSFQDMKTACVVYTCFRHVDFPAL
jgi:hypothetical protein